MDVHGAMAGMACIIMHRHLPPRTLAHAAKGAGGAAEGYPRIGGIMETMSKSGSHRFPVTVTRLPATRRHLSHLPAPYHPGAVNERRTDHNGPAHPAALPR